MPPDRTLRGVIAAVATIIDPKGADPVAFDREYVVVLSDFAFIHPHEIFRRLKQQAGTFNFQRQTVAGLLAGRDQSLAERQQWAAMRMDPTDVSDVTGSIYTFLMNGHGPKDNWTALFNPGERVRLRFINASAMTIFNGLAPGPATTGSRVASESLEIIEQPFERAQVGAGLVEIGGAHRGDAGGDEVAHQHPGDAEVHVEVGADLGHRQRALQERGDLRRLGLQLAGDGPSVARLGQRHQRVERQVGADRSGATPGQDELPDEPGVVHQRRLTPGTASPGAR